MAGIVKRKPTPAEYIEPGSMLHTHVHPETDSYISAVTRPTGRRSASITDLYVPEEHRQKGIGKMLLNSMMQQFPSLQGQVSSKIAAKNAYVAGRRMAGNEGASLDDIYKKIDEDSSVNMWTPKAAGGEVDEPGITAYHGTPHDFERFDMSKHMTGAGEQEYGHGLYFSQNEGLAKSYRPVARENTPVPVVIDGKKFHAPTAMQTLVAQHRGDVDAVHRRMTPNWNKAASEFHAAPQDPDDLGYMLAEADHQQALAQKAEVEGMRGKKIEHDYSGHRGNQALAGHTYEVHIAANPDHLLDWDLPINQQTDFVKNALGKMHNSLDESGKNYLGSILNAGKAKGEDLYFRLKQLADTPEEASKMLHAAGLKGISYLDRGARSPTEKGIRNYVVFDDKLVNVKRKYAKGGSVDEYPLDADADEHKHSGGHMSWMSPDSFLDKAQEMRGDSDDKHAIKHFEKRIKEGDKLNPLALYPKGGQDGRHRATAAKHLGIDKIPVVQWPKKRDGGSIVDRALMLVSKKA